MYRRNKLTNDLDQMADFLLKYQLTDDELNILKFADIGNVSTRFFTAFSRLVVIQQDCHQLMESGDAHGKELFQIVSIQQKDADKRLYDWTLSKCQNLEQNEYQRGTSQAFMALRPRVSPRRFVLAFRPSLVPALRPSVSSQPCSRASSHRFVWASLQRLPRVFGHAWGVGRGSADALERAMVRRRMSDPLNKDF